MNKAILRPAGRAAILLPLLFGCAQASRIPVTYSASSLGAGIFQYDFTIDNAGGSIPIAGLLVERGNSVFGLDPSSTINAPPGWDFLSPLPPFDDLLSYFSLTPASDIPIGGSLGGFTFDSPTDPASISAIDVVLVGSDSSETPYTISPEPAAVYLLGIFLIAAGAKTWRGRAGRSLPPVR